MLNVELGMLESSLCELLVFSLSSLLFTLSPLLNSGGNAGDAVVDFIALACYHLRNDAADVDVPAGEGVVGDDTAADIVMDKDEVVRQGEHLLHVFNDLLFGMAVVEHIVDPHRSALHQDRPVALSQHLVEVKRLFEGSKVLLSTLLMDGNAFVKLFIDEFGRGKIVGLYTLLKSLGVLLCMVGLAAFDTADEEGHLDLTAHQGFDTCSDLLL